MPINPLIALQGRPLDTAGSAFAVGRQRTADERTEIARDRNAIAREELEFRKAAANFDRTNARDQSRIRDVVIGSADLLSQFETGGLEAVGVFLQNRKTDLQRKIALGVDVDTRETDRAIEQFTTDPEGLIARAKGDVAFGERLKIIQPRGRTFEQEKELRAAGATKVDVSQNTGGVGGGQTRPLTKADETRDKETAKEISAFRDQGGAADAQKGIAQLEGVVKALEGGENLTGPAIGLLPDVVKTFTNPESVSVREAAEEVVQRNLRLILGAQFTEKEGERLIARAFNDRLSEEENAKRVRRLLAQMKIAFQQKVEAANYFDANGTMQGFPGREPTIADFESIDFESPDVVEGTIIENAQGERLQWRNGEWQPL